MLPKSEGLFACPQCGHLSMPADPDFKCSCSNCLKLNRASHPIERYILRILGEANDPLFPSEITDRLNLELRAGERYTMTDVAMRLKTLDRKVEQLPDGRWTMRGRARISL